MENKKSEQGFLGDIIPGQYIIFVKSRDSILLTLDSLAIKPLRVGSGLAVAESNSGFVVAELNEEQLELLKKNDNVTEVIPDRYVNVAPVEDSAPYAHRADDRVDVDIALIGYGADVDYLRTQGVNVVEQIDYTGRYKR